MNRTHSSPASRFCWTPALIMGLAAFFLSAARINHGLVDSPLPAGPGLTTDESINIRQGIYLFDAFTQHGPLILLPGKAQDVYSDPGYMADYVPLGRFLLGAAHELTAWAIPGAELSIVNVPAARLASSGALAVTVMLLVMWTGRKYGTLTAVLAAVLFLLMPRVIGHSRIASLETLTTLAWFAALMPLLAWWTGERPATTRQAVISGIMWGVLMLVKIQAVFLPPVITLYAFAMFRKRAFVPLSIMAVCGIAVFFCGWPWLWLDPIQNTLSYLASTTDRLSVNNWYLGERFADKDTPWHYPFVMMATTVPLHAGCCFALRLLHGKWDSTEKLLLLSVLLPLLAFAIPGTPVYDGLRLFLFVLPAVAIVAARGIVILFTENRFSSVQMPANGERSLLVLSRPLVAAICVVLAIDITATGTQHGPFAADAWNSAVRLLDSEPDTFEASYWGDSLNGDFWKQVPEGSTVAVAPVLHGVLLQDMMSMVPIVHQRTIQLVPFYYEPEKQRGLVLLLHRLADLPPLLRTAPEGNEAVVEVELNRRVLARLVDTSQVTWPEKPKW